MKAIVIALLLPLATLAIVRVERTKAREAHVVDLREEAEAEAAAAAAADVDVEADAQAALKAIAGALQGAEPGSFSEGFAAPLCTTRVDFLVGDEPSYIELEDAADGSFCVWNGTRLCEVLPYAQGESANGMDDNRNGLIDERGFSIDIRGGYATVRLTACGGTELDRKVTHVEIAVRLPDGQDSSASSAR